MSDRLGMAGDSVVRGDKEFGKSFIPGVGYKPATAIAKPQLRALANGQRRTMAAGIRAQERTHSAQQHEIERTMRGQHAAVKNPGIMDAFNGSKQPDIKLSRARKAPHFKFNAMTSGQMGNAKAAAIQTGGRRANTSFVLSRHDADEHTLKHEASHLAPNRSSYRARNFNGIQQAREEARADMASGNPRDYHRNTSFKAVARGGSQYALGAKNPLLRRALYNQTNRPGSPIKAEQFSREGSRAYKDVQDRIAAARSRKAFGKVDTTMSDHEANHLATRYDTRGPLPKTLSREQRMKAYEARYIAAGGKKGEKWKRRADRAETGRNIGLAGATAAGAGLLARKAPGLRRLPRHALETAAVASGTFGGASELYGEHARSRRASYQNSPAGVAGSALSRMQAYTPGR